jgi:glutathione synthase/RimK-type ligase-like ATP-grasp enzyme
MPRAIENARNAAINRNPINDWFIASNRFNSPTARELAHKLGIGFGTKPKRSRKKIIRWGYTGDLPRINIARNFPSVQSIANCSNKLKSLQILSDAGVLVPKFWTSLEQITQERNLKYPMYSRKTHHTMGKDIIMINNRDDLAKGFRNERYIVEGISYKKEYRIHIFNDEVISASKKYFREQLWQQIGSPQMKDLIRNNGNGWGYYDFQDNENVPNEAVNQAKKAVRALGLLWGAVDIIRNKDNKYYVLEVNSAPGLRDRRVDLYVNRFKELMRQN